jgi:hypothetical protein
VKNGLNFSETNPQCHIVGRQNISYANKVRESWLKRRDSSSRDARLDKRWAFAQKQVDNGQGQFVWEWNRKAR